MTVEQNHIYTEDRTVIGHVVVDCPVLQAHILGLGLPHHARLYHTYISKQCQLFKKNRGIPPPPIRFRVFCFLPKNKMIKM